jgi:hypothetical protein
MSGAFVIETGMGAIKSLISEVNDEDDRLLT